METVLPSECALWAACAFIYDKFESCPVDIIGTCPIKGSDCPIDEHITCWVLYFQRLV